MSKTTYTLSAPAKSGYVESFDDLDDLRSRAAQLLEVWPSDFVEVISPDGGTTYCYASQDEADKDDDGAYAVQYSVACNCGAKPDQKHDLDCPMHVTDAWDATRRAEMAVDDSGEE